MASPFLKEKNIVDVVKYRWFWIGFSLLLVIPSIVFMLYSTYKFHSPIKLGIDFTGGTLLEYAFDKKISPSDIQVIKEDLASLNIENPIIQTGKASKELKNQKTHKNFDVKSTVSIRTRFLSSDKNNNEIEKINTSLEKSFTNVSLIQTNAIGATLGKELFKNSLAAVLLVLVGIVTYLSFRFKTDYAIFALIALLHDAIIVCGVFALFGILYGTEIDSLFITALLTVIGFSVHDTIVVYDRIRENMRFLAKKKTFNEIVNASVNQTLARSINTSLTCLITLLALYLFGGSTTKDFVLAMLIGITVGTYSSIFNASTLLAYWREKQSKKNKKIIAA